MTRHMKIGTYYYPEQWPRDQWARDFDNIAAMGMKIVHLGEFAWFEMEPSPGDIRLDWLAECVELAAVRGLEVILCTPTAAPPVWLSDQFPETLPTRRDGTQARFGSRRHYNPTSPEFQKATLRIVNRAGRAIWRSSVGHRVADRQRNRRRVRPVRTHAPRVPPVAANKSTARSPT